MLCEEHFLKDSLRMRLCVEFYGDVSSNERLEKNFPGLWAGPKASDLWMLKSKTFILILQPVH